MRRTSPHFFLTLSALVCFWPASNGTAADWTWESASPEAHGLSSQRLDSLWTSLQQRRSTAFLVIRDDKIVFERYAEGATRSTKHYTASLAKALVGGMSAACALTDGAIALDDPAAKYIPAWKADPLKSKITLRQLGSHTSGIEDAEEGGLPHNKLTGWKGNFWGRLQPPDDPFTLARDKALVISEPGTRFQYSNPGMGMLGYAITAAEKKDLRTLLRERIMRPIGVRTMNGPSATTRNRCSTTWPWWQPGVAGTTAWARPRALAG